MMILILMIIMIIMIILIITMIIMMIKNNNTTTNNTNNDNNYNTNNHAALGRLARSKITYTKTSNKDGRGSIRFGSVCISTVRAVRDSCGSKETRFTRFANAAVNC